jgi:uncharacterized membrane protein YciS (DUF1049 family)
MRVLIVMLMIIFATPLIGIILMNHSETVTIRLWMDDPDYEYSEVPLGFVILAASFCGIVFTGIIAVVEGMRTRLDNARLTRRIRRLQKELDSIRTPALPLPEGGEGDEERQEGQPETG